MVNESDIITSFLRHENKDRVKTLIESKNGRKKFLSILAHNFINKVDPRFINQISGNKNEVIAIVKKQFDGNKCFVVSEYSKFDGLQMDLEEALEMVIGFGMGTILYNSDGTRMFYEGEEQYERYIIYKKAIK